MSAPPNQKLCLCKTSSILSRSYQQPSRVSNKQRVIGFCCFFCSLRFFFQAQFAQYSSTSVPLTFIHLSVAESLNLAYQFQKESNLASVWSLAQYMKAQNQFSSCGVLCSIPRCLRIVWQIYNVINIDGPLTCGVKICSSKNGSSFLQSF